MVLGIDHIAISAGRLQEGVEYVEAALGVPLEAGGRHLRFGSHNRLLNLGELYLEVIAIDPQAEAPFAPRWFDLDRFSGRPRPTNWICRTEAMGPALKAALPQTGPSVAVSRVDLNWLISVVTTIISTRICPWRTRVWVCRGCRWTLQNLFSESWLYRARSSIRKPFEQLRRPTIEWR